MYYFFLLSVEYHDWRDKPSVLVTSPGLTDSHIQGQAVSTEYGSNDGIFDANVGGRIQIKLGYDAGALQLAVTIICATELTLRANGSTRNPYSKVFLMTFIFI